MRRKTGNIISQPLDRPSGAVESHPGDGELRFRRERLAQKLSQVKGYGPYGKVNRDPWLRVRNGARELGYPARAAALALARTATRTAGRRRPRGDRRGRLSHRSGKAHGPRERPLQLSRGGIHLRNVSDRTPEKAHYPADASGDQLGGASTAANRVLARAAVAAQKTGLGRTPAGATSVPSRGCFIASIPTPRKPCNLACKTVTRTSGKSRPNIGNEFQVASTHVSADEQSMTAGCTHEPSSPEKAATLARFRVRSWSASLEDCCCHRRADWAPLRAMLIHRVDLRRRAAWTFLHAGWLRPSCFRPSSLGECR